MQPALNVPFRKKMNQYFAIREQELEEKIADHNKAVMRRLESLATVVERMTDTLGSRMTKCLESLATKVSDLEQSQSSLRETINRIEISCQDRDKKIDQLIDERVLLMHRIQMLQGENKMLVQAIHLIANHFERALKTKP